VPGLGASVATVLSQLEREPGEFIVDPWVTERVTLVAEQHDRVGSWSASTWLSSLPRIARFAYRSPGVPQRHARRTCRPILGSHRPDTGRLR
jgi:hypothetical protein